MLGGSFAVAFLRNGIGAALMMTVFLLLDHPRLSMKKAIGCYVAYWAVSVIVFSVWYAANNEAYVRFSGIFAIFVTGIFCVLMSGENIYLSLYRVALGFYLLSVTVFCGVDASRIWFDGNMWVDIGIRLLLAAASILFIVKKIRKSFWEGIDFFSAAALLVLVLCASLMVYLPDMHPFSWFNVVRIMVLLFMAGLIQYMVFQIYLNRGKAHRYQVEKNYWK